MPQPHRSMKDIYKLQTNNQTKNKQNKNKTKNEKTKTLTQTKAKSWDSFDRYVVDTANRSIW